MTLGGSWFHPLHRYKSSHQAEGLKLYHHSYKADGQPLELYGGEARKCDTQLPNYHAHWERYVARNREVSSSQVDLNLSMMEIFLLVSSSPTGISWAAGNWEDNLSAVLGLINLGSLVLCDSNNQYTCYFTGKQKPKRQFPWIFGIFSTCIDYYLISCQNLASLAYMKHMKKNFSKCLYDGCTAESRFLPQRYDFRSAFCFSFTTELPW